MSQDQGSESWRALAESTMCNREATADGSGKSLARLADMQRVALPWPLRLLEKHLAKVAAWRASLDRFAEEESHFPVSADITRDSEQKARIFQQIPASRAFLVNRERSNQSGRERPHVSVRISLTGVAPRWIRLVLLCAFFWKRRHQGTGEGAGTDSPRAPSIL